MNMIATVLACAALSAVFILATIKIAHRRGWLVFPRIDRWSTRPVAQLGGMAILLCLLVAAFVLPPSPKGIALVFLTISMGTIGLWDDLRSLRPYLKLLIQVILALVAVYCGFIYPLRPTPAVNILFTVVWIVGITNAFNLLDNMDGLAAGVGIITAVSILIVQTPSTSVQGLILAMVGALLGYLLFNFPPAKIFMGDTGSLAIGFFLACSFVVGAQHVSTVLSVLFTPVLVLFLPIFDMVLVSVTRRLNGRAISAGAKDHSSHRLVLLGLTERNAVLTLYTICAISGTVALLLKRSHPAAAPGVLALFLVAGTLFWLYLARIELPEDWLSRTNVFTLFVPEFLDSLAKRTAAILLDMALLLLSVYLGFLLHFGGRMTSVLYPFFVASALSLIIKTPLLALFSAYRGNWELQSLREAYPILKAAICGSLITITVLFYLTRAENFSRSVLALDFVFTVLLLSGVRMAPRLFQDILPKQQAGCLLVGGTSAQFFLHYFDWQRSPVAIRAIVDSNGMQKKVLAGVPLVALSDAPSLFEKSEVAAVYVLPDCSLDQMDFMSQLCANNQVPIHLFHLSVDTVSVSRWSLKSKQSPAQTAMETSFADSSDQNPCRHGLTRNSQESVETREPTRPASGF